MNGNKIKQIALSLVTVMVLTACGGGGSTPPPESAKSIAMNSIKAYAENGSSDAPTVQTYIDAGVQGVTSDNLADLNSLVESLEAKDVDTPEEINALTASLGVNIAPVAHAQTVTLAEDSSKAITLTATDAEGNALTYTVVTQPTHGTLSGTAPNLTYAPTANYYGNDSFSFKVNDGEADSAVVDVTLHITDVAEPNNVPVAHAQTITLAEDSSKAITLTADDANGDTLTYTLVSQPTHGALNGTVPNLSYTPTANYFGVDSFSYKANDGKADSATVMVGLTISPVNDAPTANAGADLTVEVNKYLRIEGIGSDIEGAVTYEWKSGNRVVAGIPIFGYYPDTVGTETLVLTVTDSEGLSTTDSMTITVTAKPNTAPVASSQTLTFEEDSTANAITLTATDADDDTLVYTVVTQPTHGTLGGTAPNLTYTPTADYFGADSFTFKVNDGTEDSAVVTVGITVNDVAESVIMAVKKTGQLLSYNESGDQVADDSIKDDGYYQKGVEPSYTRDDATEIVEDHLTGLMWQDNAEAKTIKRPWVTQANYDAGNYSDTSGETATTYCSELTLGTYSDWRLPTVVELQGIVVDGKTSPTIDTTAFVNYTTSSRSWTSTTNASGANYAWFVYYFYRGDASNYNKSYSAAVRCVRVGQ